MKHSIKKLLSIFFLLSITVTACTPVQPNAEQQLNDQLATMVSSTLTAMPTLTPVPTNTPLPTPTETVLPTATLISPTVTPIDMVIPTVKPEYACDVIKRIPSDDTGFRRGDPFDIKWTIVNTGTQKWEKKTSLLYQSGPEMTNTKEVALPQLKPGEKYDVVLDAMAPSDRGLQIMVWAVVGPGAVKNSKYWMCYPYMRIIVRK